MTEATCFDMQMVCTSSKLGNDSPFLRISNVKIRFKSLLPPFFPDIDISDDMCLCRYSPKDTLKFFLMEASHDDDVTLAIMIIYQGTKLKCQGRQFTQSCMHATNTITCLYVSSLKCKFTPEWLCLSMKKVWLAYKSADVYCLYGKTSIFSIHGEVFR